MTLFLFCINHCSTCTSQIWSWLVIPQSRVRDLALKFPDCSRLCKGNVVIIIRKQLHYKFNNVWKCEFSVVALVTHLLDANWNRPAVSLPFVMKASRIRAGVVSITVVCGPVVKQTKRRIWQHMQQPYNDVTYLVSPWRCPRISCANLESICELSRSCSALSRNRQL